MGGLFSIENPFWQFVNRLLHIILLNFLWLICSIPIITMGAATTAVYSVTLKMVKKQEGYTTKSFFEAFRTNFFQSTVIWLILLVIGAVIGADLTVYLRASSISLPGMLLMIAFFAASVLFVFENIYVFALQAHFDNTLKRTMGNALIMSIRHLPTSMVMVTISVLLTALGFLVFPPILFGGIALITWINSFFLVKIFDRYELPERYEEQHDYFHLDTIQ